MPLAGESGHVGEEPLDQGLPDGVSVGARALDGDVVPPAQVHELPADLHGELHVPEVDEVLLAPFGLKRRKEAHGKATLYF